jgi:hypothetical protein
MGIKKNEIENFALRKQCRSQRHMHLPGESGATDSNEGPISPDRKRDRSEVEPPVGDRAPHPPSFHRSQQVADEQTPTPRRCSTPSNRNLPENHQQPNNVSHSPPCTHNRVPCWDEIRRVETATTQNVLIPPTPPDRPDLSPGGLLDLNEIIHHGSERHSFHGSCTPIQARRITTPSDMSEKFLSTLDQRYNTLSSSTTSESITPSVRWYRIRPNHIEKPCFPPQVGKPERTLSEEGLRQQPRNFSSTREMRPVSLFLKHSNSSEQVPSVTNGYLSRPQDKFHLLTAKKIPEVALCLRNLVGLP